MSIFSKKSVFAIAAMFLACVMFAGCGDKGDEPGPGKKGGGTTPTGGVSLLTEEWEESWTEITYSGGEITGWDFDAGDGSVRWDAKVPQEDPGNGIYPGAQMAVYFESAGKLKSGTKIVLTYKASYHIHLILLMDEGSITKDQGDAEYFAALDAADKPRTITLDLSKNGGNWADAEEEGDWGNMSGNHFRQPAWATASKYKFDLDISKIAGIAFSIPSDAQDENSTDVEITKLEITGSNL